MAIEQVQSTLSVEGVPRIAYLGPQGTFTEAALIEARNGKRVLVINAMGRIFMDPLDDPFTAVDHEITACALGSGADAIIIDMHAEATSEKQSLGYFVDGRATLVVGTHTHTPTADHQIFSGGTAFISDVGMTGPYESVIGMEREQAISRFLTQTPHRMTPASGDPRLAAAMITIDAATGRAQGIQRFLCRESD